MTYSVHHGEDGEEDMAPGRASMVVGPGNWLIIFTVHILMQEAETERGR